jgi:uncharacterized iron-regulated membrane protein
MRKYHRWLSVLFGVFLLWIAITGVLSQIVPLVQRGGFENEAQEKAERAEALARATPPGFVCPETLTCQPKRKGGSIVGLLHHLHSGESFGPLGTIIATLSGLAMIFFAFSGLWLYVQMWRNRAQRGLTPRWWWS